MEDRARPPARFLHGRIERVVGQAVSAPEAAVPAKLKRRSRMSRRASDKRIELTPRDLEIFRLLARYRYLRSTYIHALVGGKSQKRLIEQLGHLYHEGGYLDRPAQQWQAINARYMPVVYELGEAGSRALEAAGSSEAGSSLELKAHHREHRQFNHELMICEILGSIELGTRADAALRFIPSHEVLAKAPETTRRLANPFAVPISVSHKIGDKIHSWDKPLVPDALFGIEYATEGQKRYRFFALEADRNSEPIMRATLQQSSFARKIVQYREVIAQTIHKTYWGLPNLFVLTVTTNERHTKNMMQRVAELTEGKGSPFLLFKTMPSLASLEHAPLPTPHMLREPWQRVEHEVFGIDRP